MRRSRWDRLKDWSERTARATPAACADEWRHNKVGLALAAGFIAVAVALAVAS
jgi:hypothetical protein